MALTAAAGDVAPDFLDLLLAPLAPLLAREGLTDLYVNRPGEVWVEMLGGAIERLSVPDLTAEWLWRLARQVARASGQAISRSSPLLGATLPSGARIQIVAGTATRGDLALAIRRAAIAAPRLSDYAAAGAFADTGTDWAEADPDLARLDAAGDHAGFLAAAVRARKTILVSGGTASGKTTFVNALLAEIAADERLILIEDTPELVVTQPNVVGLVARRGRMAEADVTPEDLLQASLRLRPDRIIMGEVRGTEAFTFLRAVNTGHPGSITTIHADHPQGAIDQLAFLVLQAGTRLSHADVADYVRHVVDVFVHLERRNGQRRVAALLWRDRNGAA